uniref:Leucine rich repeat containing 46 n=1 Tax=Sphenodon punctatus TaxID=8508 RepID=A0A8D0HEH4_SPHPU
MTCRFLSLAGNHICRVENLRDLQRLQFLDLSQNRIKTLDTDELPQSLVILDLTGNRCTQLSGYRERVLRALPGLKKLDSQSVPIQSGPAAKEEVEKEGSDDSDYEDYDFPELTKPFSMGKEFFADLHQELVGRSEKRREAALNEHQGRLELLTDQQRPPHRHACSLKWDSPQAPSLGKARPSACGLSKVCTDPKEAVAARGLGTSRGAVQQTSIAQQVPSRGEVSTASRTADKGAK